MDNEALAEVCLQLFYGERGWDDFRNSWSPAALDMKRASMQLVIRRVLREAAKDVLD
jgi:hypothetical protein